MRFDSRRVSQTLFLIALAVTADGQVQPVLTLAISPAGATASQMLTIAAALTPPASTGKVWFYDGVVPLGAAPMIAGKAVFSTSTLLSGTHALFGTLCRGFQFACGRCPLGSVPDRPGGRALLGSPH